MSDHDENPRLRSLLRLAREVTARHDLDDVLAAALVQLRSTVQFAAASIQLIDDDGWITVAACDPAVPAEVLETRLPLGNSVEGRVVLTEQPIYVPDVKADGRDVLLPLAEWAEGVRSYLAVPLLADGRAIGLLRFDDARPDPFTDSDRLMLIAAGAVVASAIQNARAQARVALVRSRIDGLERRLRQLYQLLPEAPAAAVMTDQQLRSLLAGIERELTDSMGSADQDGSSSRVTL
jgi:GAF domain-containing protein